MKKVTIALVLVTLLTAAATVNSESNANFVAAKANDGIVQSCILTVCLIGFSKKVRR